MHTYTEIQKQIAALQKQAESARKQEIFAAVKEAKRLISTYGLTAQDLGINASGSSKRGKGAQAKATKSTVKKAGKKSQKRAGADKRSTVAIKYRDDEGNSWTGRGKPPRWLAAKLAAGAALEQFRI